MYRSLFVTTPKRDEVAKNILIMQNAVATLRRVTITDLPGAGCAAPLRMGD